VKRLAAIFQPHTPTTTLAIKALGFLERRPVRRNLEGGKFLLIDRGERRAWGIQYLRIPYLGDHGDLSLALADSACGAIIPVWRAWIRP